MSFYANVEVDGFSEFEEMLKEVSANMDEENILSVLENGAEQFVKDVKALPRPRSLISKPGYTHILSTISHRRNKGEIETGWGKYYGPMLEKGTNKMSARRHMKTTFQTNSEKYYKTMTSKLFGGI